VTPSLVARASRPLWREHPARAFAGAGRPSNCGRDGRATSKGRGPRWSLSPHSLGRALPFPDTPVLARSGLRKYVHARNAIHVPEGGVQGHSPFWHYQRSCAKNRL